MDDRDKEVAALKKARATQDALCQDLEANKQRAVAALEASHAAAQANQRDMATQERLQFLQTVKDRDAEIDALNSWKEKHFAALKAAEQAHVEQRRVLADEAAKADHFCVSMVETDEFEPYFLDVELPEGQLPVPASSAPAGFRRRRASHDETFV